MGNSSSRRSTEDDVDPPSDLDDFEPIDKPASPSFMNGPFAAGLRGSGSSSGTSPNDLATSGILVDMSDDEKAMISKRRIVKVSSAKDVPAVKTSTAGRRSDVHRTKLPAADDKEDLADHKRHHHHDLPVTALGKSQQTDTELLKESLERDKELRMQKLQTDQKSRRHKAVEERRKTNASPPTVVLEANPFSRFLSVFSVEPQFPSHKRRYEPGESELEQDAKNTTTTSSSSTSSSSSSKGGGTGTHSSGEPTKRPKLDPMMDKDADSTTISFSSILVDWLDAHLPEGWPWMAAAGTAAVALVIVSAATTRSSQKQRTATSSSLARW